MWLPEKIPFSWKEAIIVPIPRPNRDLLGPTNYRPIALTSCLCKTIERMVNGRLVRLLESTRLVSKSQCGFRKNHSTLDNFVCFEHFIRKAFASFSRCFYFVKFYDSTGLWSKGNHSSNCGVTPRSIFYMKQWMTK